MAEQPNAEPDEVLLASLNWISINVTTSGRREEEPGGQRSSALPACILCQAGTPQHPGVPHGLSVSSAPLVIPGQGTTLDPGEL